jgi:xanthine dehydrogenase YagR molybdenum-binding subunit
MNAIIGQPISRVDGPAKVTGSATYAGEFNLPGLAHAAMVLSTIPHGRIVRMDTVEAERAPSVPRWIRSRVSNCMCFRTRT